MKKLNNQGIAHTAVIAIIAVVLAGIGYGGYRVYSAKNTKDNAKGATGSTSNVSKTDTKTKDSPENNKTKYFAIKEWGVKIPLTAEGEALTYKKLEYNSGTSADPIITDSMIFRSVKLNEAGCKQDTQGVTLYRGKATDAFIDENGVKGTFLEEYNKVKGANGLTLSVGNYYYFIPRGGASCGGSSAAETAANSEIVEVLKKMVVSE